MAITLKGTTRTFVVAGDRAHEFTVPLDRDQLHPKVLKALDALQAAGDAEQKVMREKRSDRAAMADANDAIRDAVDNLYDVAGANARPTREHAAEQYDMAARRYARAIEQAQGALQSAVTAAQVFDLAAGGHAVGISDKSRALAVTTAHMLSQQIDALVALPAVDAQAGQ